MDETAAALEQMRGRWMTGASAVDAAPAAWAPALDGASGGEADLRLAALAAQALHVAYLPSPPGELKARPDLPMLALPVLPEHERARFRRIAEALRQDKPMLMRVLRVIGLRGHVVHPADWLPSASADDVPAVYGPWARWAASGEKAEPEGEEITADTWDAFYHFERRDYLSALRGRDPAAARALIEEKAPGEPAERRVALIELMAIGLSEDDVPFLQSLATDRSGKVKALAARFLGRLGKQGGDREAADELAGFLELGRAGILKRRDTLTPRKLKTTAQANRRAQLFDEVSLADLAASLGLDPIRAAGIWEPEKDDTAAEGFGRMVAATAPDAALAVLAQRQVEQPHPEIAAAIAPRLAADELRMLTRAMLARLDERLALVLPVAGDDLGWAGTAELEPGLRVVLGKLADIDKTTDAHRARRIGDETVQLMLTLGLMASGAAARAIIDRFTGAGLSAADPRLDLLRLNAALSEG